MHELANRAKNLGAVIWTDASRITSVALDEEEVEGASTVALSASILPRDVPVPGSTRGTAGKRRGGDAWN